MAFRRAVLFLDRTKKEFSSQEFGIISNLLIFNHHRQEIGAIFRGIPV
jgi:hypothetical protein